MVQRNCFVPVLGLLLFINACGGGGGPSTPLSPLTEPQKTVLKDTMNSIGRLGRAIEAIDLPSSTPHSILNSTPQNLTSSRDPNEERMRELLHQGTKSGQCKFSKKEVTPPQNSNGIGFFSYSIQMEGPLCPVTHSMGLEANTTATAGNGRVWLQYRVQAEEYLQLNDVDKIDFSIQFQGGVSATNQSKIDATIRGEGSIHSQKQGPVSIQIQASATGKLKAPNSIVKIKTIESVEGTLRFLFRDFTAEFKITGNDKEARYFLNQQEVSKEEMEVFFK